MEYLRKQKKWLVMAAVFMAGMLLCTMVSKSVYANTLPVIKTAAPEKREIGHLVKAQGMVEQSLEYAVSVLDGLKVNTVYTTPGDNIEEGSLLFDIDMEDLKQLIREKELELKKLELETAALAENKALEDQQKQLETDRARQDYQTTVGQVDRDLKSMQEEEKQADGKLKAHMNGRPAVTSQEDRAKRQEAYSVWEQELAGEQQALKEQREELAGTDRIIARLQEQLAGNGGSVSDGDRQQLEQELAAAQQRRGQQEREAAAREESILKLQEGAPAKPDFTQEDALLDQWEKEKTSLEEAAKQAGDGRTEKIDQINRNVTDAARKVEDATASPKKDTGLEVNRMELEYKREELARYKEVLGQEGKIYSKAAGVVTAVNVAAGQRTPDSAAIVYADMEANLRFKALLTREQKKYVDMGSEATLNLGSGFQTVKGQVDYIQESSSSPGSYEALLLLEQGEARMGQSGTMSVTKQSPSYGQCIPAGALHTEDQRSYIYVVRAQTGILGEELAAEKRFVNVEDQNDKYVALEEGTLEEGEKVIIFSTKPLEDGTVVRYGL